MANDSSTGGYLVPTSTGSDLNDIALATFLQGVVVGITGLPGNMVRPRYQLEPPNVPDLGINWAAISRGTAKRDPFAAVIHIGAGDGDDLVVRNRTVEVLCSFYGPAAETNGELLAMGMEVAQNREAMRAAGFALVGGVGDAVIAPAQIKGKWTYRVDIGFTVRQQQQYTYPILNLEAIQATLTSDAMATTETISAVAGGYGGDGFGENQYGQ